MNPVKHNEAIIPVITIDGPSGVGKGTIARLLAEHLRWHLLDSGALYRVLAYAAEKKQLEWQDESALAELAMILPVRFSQQTAEKMQILLDDSDITEAIRSEHCGINASKVAVFPAVRQALLARQRAFRRPPGLVADGRDMGTVVFPDAQTKIFLTASSEARAQRRFQELNKIDNNASISAVLEDIRQRDFRDANRLVAPLKPAIDAVSLDTTSLSIDAVFQQVLAMIVHHR